MKYHLVIRQGAVVRAEYVGKVTLPALCLLDYLKGWVDCDKAKRVCVQGETFTWLDYAHAISELPILFNHSADPRTLKNQLSLLMRQLRNRCLIHTIRDGRGLFFRLTATGLYLVTPYRDGRAQDVTPRRVETVTSEVDKIVTPRGDDSGSANIDETSTKETETKESPPLSPSEGEAERIVTFWNSFSQLPPAKCVTPDRARKIRKRLVDPFWRHNWQEGIKRVASCAFTTGGGSNGWRATFDWFLGSNSLAKIIEGAYDNKPPNPNRAIPVFELRERLKAIETLIKEHHVTYCGKYDDDVTAEQRKDYHKLQRDREELLRQLSSVA